MVLLTLGSCTSAIDQQINGFSREGRDRNRKFQAATEQSVPSTKVFADEDMKVLWNADDRISIFNMSTYNYQYVFTGDDGDTAGGFEEIPASGFITGQDVDYVYAAYPYNKNNKLSNRGVFTMTLPAEQTWKEHSFGIGANTMVTVTDGSFLAFKNVGGYLSLQLYGDNVSVSKITIQGNNGEKIAGKAAISIPMNGLPTVTMDDSATDAVSVVCDPAVQLGSTAEEYTDFWFVIPPVTFEQGFTITVTDEQGGTFTKSTTRSFTVSRNQLDWMNPLEVVPNYDNVLVEFEDENFKAYCVENFDLDGDEEISRGEALEVTEIIINNLGIFSLSGIEFFPNLEIIGCNSNKLTSVDLSGNPLLKSFDAWHNQLTSINVSANPNVTYLGLAYNELESLDVSSCPSLVQLECGANNLIALNTSNNDALWRLECDNNKLSSLDISCNGNLEFLHCSSNNIGSLDVSNNHLLKHLYCYECGLSYLDVSSVDSLKTLTCNGNALVSLDVSNNLKLKSLRCDDNPDLNVVYLAMGQEISQIDKDDHTIIRYVGQTIIDESTFPDDNFRSYVSANIDNDHNGFLSDEECESVTSIQVCTDTIASMQGIELFENLKILTCLGTGEWVSGEWVWHGKLENLDVSSNSELTLLDCSRNRISLLDVSKNVKLTRLNCECNPLGTIDVSKNIALTSLWCTYNQLSALDVSNNVALSDLLCSYNQLTTVDVSMLSQLQWFECLDNQITSLNLSNNLILTKLYCNDNLLSSLDVSNNKMLNALWCYSNPLLTTIWLESPAQTIESFTYDTAIVTIRYTNP